MSPDAASVGDPSGTETAELDQVVPPEGGPEVTDDQQADVESVGVAVANTGLNVATAGDSSGPGAEPGPAVAGVTTGTATAVGGTSSTAIAQTASANVADNAKVMIYQLALVINFGLALAESGANSAAAGLQGGSGGEAIIQTGDATAAGLQGNTAVMQVVHLLDANETANQQATVVNVGLGVSNSGGNLALLGPSNGSARTAVAVEWAPAGDAGVTTGSAAAIGDASNTSIIQVAVGVASGDGVLRITQYAVVVNFGVGFANSGGNGAGGGAAGALAEAVLAALLQGLSDGGFLGGAAADSIGVGEGGSGGAGSALITTGDASAVGNQSTTTVVQRADGLVTGGHEASATQTAAVGNFGVALANSGANVAGGGNLVTTPDPLVQNAVAWLLSLLLAPGGEGSWATTLSYGAEMLRATSALSILDTVLGPAADEGDAGAVSIRQISGVLNLMFAFASSGGNVSTAEGGEVPDGGEVTLLAGLVDPETTDPAVSDAVARIVTGDANAVGSRSTVVVCQVINVSTDVCPHATEPEEPVVEPPVVDAAVVTAAPAQAVIGGETLAFTGAGGLGAELVIAGLLLCVGIALVRASRRAHAPP